MEEFIENLSVDEEAFMLFKEKAVKKGIFKEEPLSQMRVKYYDRYIKPTIEMSFKTNRSASKMTSLTNDRSTLSHYIPLRDLLR